MAKQGRYRPIVSAAVNAAQHDAAIFETTLEDYVLRTLERQADAIERESPSTVLSARDFRRFLEICKSGSPPSPDLMKAAERYKCLYPALSIKERTRNVEEASVADYRRVTDARMGRDPRVFAECRTINLELARCDADGLREP